MITYQPFWETLKNSKESTYSLIHNHSISSATINRLRQNQPVSTSTINDLCIILNCTPGDILAFTPSGPDQIILQCISSGAAPYHGNNSQSIYGFAPSAVLY